MKGTDKMTSAELLANEPALLKGLLQAGNQVANAENAVTVVIERSGKMLTAFKIKPLTEPEFVRCREQATIHEMVRGVKTPVRFDKGLFRSLALHKATMPPAGSTLKIWDHQEAWKQFGDLTNGVELIDKILLAGEKERAYLKLEEISGYVTDEDGDDVTQLTLENTVGE